ncbi:hypothetical protein ACIQT7_13025 [Agrobacterium deltaense]
MPLVAAAMEFQHITFDTFQALQGGNPGGQPTVVLHGFPDHPPNAGPFIRRHYEIALWLMKDTVDTLISATSVNAEMIMMDGRISVIRPGALADTLVVDADPTVDCSVFTRRGENIDVIMKDGTLSKNRL